MKAIVKKIIPTSVIRLYRKNKVRWAVINDYIYDYRKFINQSSSFGLQTQANMRAFMIKEYHAIEKGLALRHPKPGFGVNRINRLLDILDQYEELYGSDEVLKICLRVLEEYMEFDGKNNSIESPLIKRISNRLTLTQGVDSTISGGTRAVSKSEILKAIDFDFESFIKSRFSTRDFSNEPVETSLLLKAIDLARFCPSACNRQAWKVQIIESTNQVLKDKVLDIQNGNRGFREHISALLVITGQISSFGDYERNQAFIDGGLFAMTLLMALHAEGLGTCCLNTSFTSHNEKRFNRVMNIGDDSVPIMLIAVGHLKSEYRVARSPRKGIHEVVTILSN